VNWRFCTVDPQDAAFALCSGTMDEGNGWGNGNGYGDGYGWRDCCADGDGYGNGYGYGWGDGGSPKEWK